MKTLAIVSQKGGAGKTTIAIHLDAAIEVVGFRVAVSDLDPRVLVWPQIRPCHEV